MKLNGAQALMMALMQQKVDILFGYPGGAIMPVYDALYDASPDLTHILVRHEQGAVHAAEGYARATGKVGVCVATSGPGGTNLVTGIADAMLDSVPIVCITGQVTSHLLGTDAFQEADMIGITIPITKWNYQITRAEDIPDIIAKAFYYAQTGRPGPVLIDITKDAQSDMFEWPELESWQPPVIRKSAQPTFNQDKIQQAAALINTATKPYILAGHGILIANACDELQQFAEKSGIPVASTLLGLSALANEHPLHVGMLGMHGHYGPNVLTNEADVIIAIGMRFDDRVTGDLSRYAKQASIIHIDIDHTEINKNVMATVDICADAKQALTALIAAVQPNQHPEWLAQFKAYKQQEYNMVTHEELNPEREEIRMAEVIVALSEKTHGEAIIVTDVGQHQMIAARYYQFNQPHSLISSGGLGTMGYALPAAIGAKLGQKDREVIVVVGDGGFQMTLQEMAVLCQENLNVKILLLNNNYLGMVRQWQELFFEQRYAFTKLHNPDFVLLAQSYGIPGAKVNAKKDLEQGIDQMLTASGAFLLEVAVEKQHNVFPMIPSGACVTDVRLK